MAEQTDQRLAAALEQLHQDERLTADLTDADAQAVFAWFEDELRSAQSLDDPQFDARLTGLRRGVKQAARKFAGDPHALIAAARAAAGAPTAVAASVAIQPATGTPEPIAIAVDATTSPAGQGVHRRWLKLSSRTRRRKRRGWSS